MVVFTALACGGWFLIPLKFAWDQLAEESDSARQELANQADDHRQTATKMRELVFENIRSHFGPMPYRRRAVAGWAAHWRLAFQGNLHRIPQEDYALIVSEMKAAAAASA